MKKCCNKCLLWHHVYVSPKILQGKAAASNGVSECRISRHAILAHAPAQNIFLAGFSCTHAEVVLQ